MREKPTILVIDNSPDSLALIQAVLKDNYLVRGASNSSEGLRMASSDAPPDLILLDVMLTDMDGHAVCRQLKADTLTQSIPILFLTTKSDQAEEEMGFEIGAGDYITKPVSAPILRNRVRNQLMLRSSIDFLHNHDAFLETEVANRTKALTAIQNVTVLALASLAETRDADTGNHLRRTQRYVRALAWKLSSQSRFSAFLTPANVGLLFRSAPLHDIGKVGIPDRILLKPGKLTPEEFEIMKTHTTLGRDAIARAADELGEDVAFLTLAKEIAYSHQEKWDGSGYPQGLQGEQIPISARIMALADVYDALISRRVYKEPLPHAQAVHIIEQVSGRHFDPDVVQAFVAIQDTFETIALAFADSYADLQPKVDYLKIAQGNAP
ncbi:MAG: two-component system response regulator [Burkholderiales bacterium]